MKYSNTSLLTNRVTSLITHNNDTEGNSELIDIRTGFDGTVYESAGNAVRGQIEKTKSNIDAHLEFINRRLGFSDTVVENSEFIQGAYVDSNGYRSDGTYANMRTHNKLLPLSNYIVHLSSYPENMLVSIGLFSDGNGTWLRLYPTLVPITNGEYIIDTEDILTHFPGATHIRVNILSYADNTYYDISDVKINVYNQQGQTIIDQVEDLSESLNDYGENLDSQNVRLQKLESNKFILPLFNRGYKSINIIGDSISQGAAASSIPNNSYCGILRKMFSAELGGRLNYGFSAFDKSTDLGFDSSTVTWVYGSPMYGWQRNFADSSVLGGDSYTSSATNSRFCFKLWKNSHYLQIAIVGGSGKGSFELQNGNGNVIAEIDCSTYPQGACLTDKIDISEIDASNGYEFLIVTKSADTVIISGVSLSDNDDYWTFNNYGRAGASPSVFTGDIFDKESRCSVLVYALGVNSGIDNLNNALASIKNTAKSLNAQKIVLCLCFKGNGFDNRSGGKPQALKAFSDDIGALFIDVYEHCPKDSNGYIVDGILSSDNIHPTDEGHRFIAELIAKNIGLSCNSGDDSTCNSELIDIRTGADGSVYDSAGVAIRTAHQNLSTYIDKLKTGLNYHAENNYSSFSLEQGHLANGIETASTTRVRSTASSIITVDNTVSITITNNNTSTYKMFICIYNQDGTFHDALAWKSQSVYTYNLQSGYKYRFVFGKNDDTDLTVNDVMPVFSFLVGDLRPYYSLERIDQLEAQQSLILKRQNMILKNDSFFSIAHQGFHTVYANQTLNAYIAAGESGFNWAECDASVTSDGTIICCHNDIVYADTNTMRINPTLNSASGSFTTPIQISDTTYQELLSYDIAKWKDETLETQSFPKLDDVMKTTKKYNMGLVVDDFFKIHQANKSTEFYSMVRQYGMENKIAVTTVNSVVAENLPKANYFSTATEATWQDNLHYLQTIKNTYGNNCYINIQYNALTDSVINAARTAGIGILVWTVNTLSDYKSIMPYVDGITSDYFTRFDTE